MTLIPHEEAIQRLCPIMSNPDGARACVGMSCMSWMWDPQMTDENGNVVPSPYGSCHLTQPAPK